MNRTARIIVATGVALSVIVPAFGDTASAAPSETTTETTITVRAGDSLAGLAWRHKVSLSALLRANSLELTSVVHPGDTLVIPAGASTTSFNRPTSSPATPTAAPGATAGTSTYVVKAGDALSLIAWRNGVRLSALLEANNLSASSLILPGRQLRIPPATRPVPSRSSSSTATASPTPTTTAAPATSSRPAATSGGTEYVVKPGDALSLIAWRHGVRLTALLDANGIKATSLILPGQRLRVPTATRSVPAIANTPQAAPAKATAAPAAAKSSVDTVVSYATAQVGAPYRFFTAGPATFDCSGLVVAAFRQVGMSVPHQSRALAKLGTPVDWRAGSIAAGDLVFTSSTNDPDMITHVGIAIDSKRWVHAIGFGRTVSIGSLPADSKIMAVQRLAMP